MLNLNQAQSVLKAQKRAIFEGMDLSNYKDEYFTTTISIVENKYKFIFAYTQTSDIERTVVLLEVKIL